MDLTRELTVPYEVPVGFDHLYGLVVDAVAEDRMEGHVVIGEQHRQPAGIVHGGVYAAIAEAIASIGTALVVAADGRNAMGLSNHTSFLRPIAEGTIHARADRRHRGRTTWVWDVELTDDAGRAGAISRVTIAVR